MRNPLARSRLLTTIDSLIRISFQRLERAPELSENALRNLATVAEAAQRIARLALGVSTENLHTSQDPYAATSEAERAAELRRLGIELTEPTLH